MSRKSIVVMAAGMGSRFGGLKQLSTFGKNNETLLDFAIQDAISAGFEKAVFVIRADIEKPFRQALSGKYEKLMDVRYVFQDLNNLPFGLRAPQGRTKPWGTGQAALSAAAEIEEPFLAVNADDYYGPGAYVKMAEFLDSGGTDYALAGYRLKNTLSQNGGVSRGICSFDSDMFMTGVREYTDLKPAGASGVSSAEGACFTGEELVSLNFWAFRHEFMDLLSEYFGDFIKENINDSKSEFYLPSAVNRAVGEGRAKVRVIPVDEIWQGVTYKADKPAVEDFLRKNRKGFA